MGRRKIEIKAIKDDRNRSVTFLKRKGGLFKKAHELSVLCSVDVAVIIFGHNKKLYEFSSGDINEILGRYHYTGPPHEHKGPADFNGKKDLDEDEDDEMGSPAPESPSSQEHHMIPPHLQNQAAYQHMRQQTASASPPIPNVPFHPRHGTPPQQQGISRPSSRTNVRRTSSNLVPQQQQQQSHPHQHTSQAPPTQNGYAYRPNPPIYNPQAGAGMPLQPGPGQAPPYQHQYPQPQPPPPHHHPNQSVYMQDSRRQSMPPAFPQDRSGPPPPPPPQPSEPSPPQHPQHHLESHQHLTEPKRLSAKSKSIFTPVDESRSLLAQHWGMGTTSSPNEPAPRREEAIKNEGDGRSRSVDMAPLTRNGPNDGQRPQRMPPLDEIRPSSRSTNPPQFAPPRPQQQQQAPAKRPRLKVQIPSEQSDGGSATAESSPRNSAGTTTGGAPSAQANTEGSHSSGVVLPPPSPSASAILSAGATGPGNPFARPNPPSTSNNQSNQSNPNNSSNNNNNNIETPMSALPSRFMAEGLLPSPSSFYPGWDFGRGSGSGGGGSDSNILPSPLNYQTPVGATGPSFLRDENEGMGMGKRKSVEADSGGGSDGVGSKRVKT
ncbi:MAG: hypothetical protein M4579_006059 [Chaenotheca gracillima]|nr:MAG: hypothetical protein M4579_006059 [Chaenotheca gracillima]